MVRVLRHLMMPKWLVGRYFPHRVTSAIEHAVSSSEQRHMGELRFAVEAALDLPRLLRGMEARDRALEVFSQLRVWDTEHNSGVLIYLLLAERRVEIVADRGIHAKVGSAQWEQICSNMEMEFQAGRFAEGVLGGIDAVTALLAKHFPAESDNPNELSDRPVVL